MAKLLFKLNNVPDDEADEIREILTKNTIDYYETSAGLLGFSFAGIWLKNEQDYSKSKQLLDEYQVERYNKVSQHHQELKQAGENITLWKALKNSPIKTTLAIIFASLLLYFSTIPFFSF